MQIVISIPKDRYKRIIEHTEGIYDQISLLTIIEKGTPLPKGHGRIADIDAAIKCIKEVKGEDAIWAISLIEWACGKRTIIEADKESEDKNENDQR